MRAVIVGAVIVAAIAGFVAGDISVSIGILGVLIAIAIVGVAILFRFARWAAKR